MFTYRIVFRRRHRKKREPKPREFNEKQPTFGEVLSALVMMLVIFGVLGMAADVIIRTLIH